MAACSWLQGDRLVPAVSLSWCWAGSVHGLQMLGPFLLLPLPAPQGEGMSRAGLRAGHPPGEAAALPFPEASWAPLLCISFSEHPAADGTRKTTFCSIFSLLNP